jgi:cytoskeletal protein CcmA (bactofilin family)
MAETKITKGITIDGEIQAQEPVTIEGLVKGRIATSELVTVATGGVVEANVETTQIQIHGTFTGDIAAKERVEISPSGKMTGDVRAPRILIADGANFKGHIDMDVN